MKQILLFIATILISATSFAQGNETFTNYPETGSSYKDGTFTGLDGSTWTYTQSRGDIEISGATPMLGKNRSPIASMTSGTISGGCGTLSFDYMQAFSTNVNLEVLINGNKVATFTTSGEKETIKGSGPIIVNASGDFTISFVQASGGGQACIDNVVWTAYSGGPASIELTSPNGGETFDAGETVDITWTSENITSVNLEALTKEGWISISSGPIAASLETYSYTTPENIWDWDGYKIRVSDVTNSSINDESDATFTITGHDQSLVSHSFNGADLGSFTAISELGDQEWQADHGSYARMNGYSSGAQNNEDWLIFPIVDLEETTHEILEFMAYYNYDGPDVQLLYTTAFNGVVSASSWIELPFTKPSAKSLWEYVRVDISRLTGNVYFAFKYTSNTGGAAEWMLNNFLISGIESTTTDLFVGTEKAISAYPNPFNSEITVSAENVATIELINAVGQTVKQVEVNGMNNLTVPTSELSTGIYIIKLTDVNGKVTTQKVMKK